MATKTDIRKLIRGGLTGEEAGKLVLQDNWLVDRGKEGFLSQRDMADIKSSLKTSRDIDVYNSYIELYRLVDYTLKDAQIYARDAQFYLLWLDKILEGYLKKASLRWTLIFDIPAIVTQKQYEELSQKQREHLLKEPISLGDALERRSDLEPGEETDKGWPEEWRSAIHELQELIREGKLTPLRVKDKQDYRDFLKKKIDYQPAKDTVEKLDAWLAGELSEEEADSLIELTAFIGAELYGTGLPEWIDWIDTYKPSLEKSTMARPDGMMQAQRVAVIQNPKPEEIDERGYWIEDTKYFSDKEPDIEADKEHIKLYLSRINNRVKNFLSMQAVMDAISQIVGVDFSEDMRAWYEGIEAMATIFNMDVKSLWSVAHAWMKDLGLGDGKEMPYEIKIGRLKPTAKSLRYYQERMALALGDGWMREAVQTLEYEPQDKDTLAQEIADEIADELDKRAKEEKDG